MRLANFSCWVVVIFLISASVKNGSAEPPFTSSPSLDQAVETVNTPKAVAKFMKEEFIFTEDAKLFEQEDYWQSPEELWVRRRGDCEDYALFAQYALKKHGTEGEVVSLYGANGYAHTVFIFERNGRYDVINEDRFYSYRAGSLEKAVTRVYPYWTWAAIAATSGGRGRSLRVITNPTPSKPLSENFPDAFF